MSGEELKANNLSGLLKFCLAADDGSKKSPTNPEELKEKAAWFQKFIQECSINIGQKMVDDLKILSLAIENKKVDDSIAAALEELQDITENVDLAKDFIKMGGFEIVRRLIEMDVSDITIEGAQIIGNVTQNDISCQKAAVDKGLISFLLSQISFSTNGQHIKKLVYALSCCVRGSECGVDEFKSKNGIKIILTAMTSGNGEAKAKCSFLLFCIFFEDNTMILNEVDYSYLLDLMVQSPDLSHEGIEHLLGLLKISLQRYPLLIKCYDAQYKEKLEEFLLEDADKEEFEDIVGHISEILKILK